MSLYNIKVLHTSHQDGYAFCFWQPASGETIEEAVVRCANEIYSGDPTSVQTIHTQYEDYYEVTIPVTVAAHPFTLRVHVEDFDTSKSYTGG